MSAGTRPKPWETSQGQQENSSAGVAGGLGAEAEMPVLPPKPESLAQPGSSLDPQQQNMANTDAYGSGYNGNSYGSSLNRYGSSMGLGGGMYGSSYGMGSGIYGSSYGLGGAGYGGYGMGGAGYGGYGMGYGMGGAGFGLGGMGGLGDSTNQALSLLESLLLTFSSLTTLLESTYYATNNAMMSIGSVMGQIGAVTGVIGGIGSMFVNMGDEFKGLIKSLLRLVVKLIIKTLRLVGLDSGLGLGKISWMRNSVMKLLQSLNLDDELVSSSAKKDSQMVKEFIKWKRAESKEKRAGSKVWPMVVLLATVFSLPIIMKKLAEYHDQRRTPEQRQIQQQQHQQQTAGQRQIASAKASVDPKELTFAKAKYPFTPEDPSSNELALEKGDLVAVLEEPADSEWWYCRTRDGRMGYVPMQWLIVVKRAPAPVAAPTATLSPAESKIESSLSQPNGSYVAQAVNDSMIKH